MPYRNSLTKKEWDKNYTQSPQYKLAHKARKKLESYKVTTRARESRNYKRWKDNKSCTRCGLPIIKFTMCLKHRRASSLASKRYYRKNKSKGLISN